MGVDVRGGRRPSRRRDWASAVELSDLVVDVDPASGERRPVAVADVRAALEATGDAWGVRLLQRLPAAGGVLEVAAVDDLLLRVHSELSRLGQEFAQPARLRSLLAPIVDALRRHAPGEPIRIVDVGCGVGYAVRWLARDGRLGDDVELIGCDLNPVLVEEAQRLAGADGVSCTFEVADALHRAVPASIVTSAGLLHHFRGDALQRFFAEHDGRSVRAFVHYDVTPTPLPLRLAGAWVFHLARMREPVSRHDGVISAMRAHSDRALVDAATAGAPWADVALYGPAGTGSPFVNVMRPVVGMAPGLAGEVRSGLGKRARRLVDAADLR